MAIIIPLVQSAITALCHARKLGFFFFLSHGPLFNVLCFVLKSEA